MRLAAAIFCSLIVAACGPAERPVQSHPAEQPPALLSDWHIFKHTGSELDLNTGVIPYELNTPLFSDYALKLRTVWMPDGTFAKYDAKQEFDFPVGTIISKTFHYRKGGDWSAESFHVVATEPGEQTSIVPPLMLDEYVLVETRLLVRYADGWQGFPYVWNAAQTDATLEIAGDVRSIELEHGDRRQDIHYVVPDVNQCAGCHTPNHSAGDLRPLGPKAWQLNRGYAWWGDDSSQIDHWRERELLQNAPGTTVAEPVSLRRRAREYLDANCAHCHNPAGAADTSALHLNIDAPVDRKLGICKTPVAVGRGSGDLNYDIYPGRPDESIMIFRMQHSDPAIAMPELGRSAVHSEGVALISEWISTMSGEC
jgi:uncharacterized repeat protein (TIGR03806 family)